MIRISNNIVENTTTNIRPLYFTKSHLGYFKNIPTVRKKDLRRRQINTLSNFRRRLSNNTISRTLVISNSMDAEYLLHGMTHADIFINSALSNFLLLHLPTICIYRGVLRFSWSYISYSLLVISFIKTLIELYSYLN